MEEQHRDKHKQTMTNTHKIQKHTHTAGGGGCEEMRAALAEKKRRRR